MSERTQSRNESQNNTSSKKLLLLILIAIVAGVLLFVAAFSTLHTSFNMTPAQDQDAEALAYLEERYGQEFTIVQSNSGVTLGSVAYNKTAAPVANPSQEFQIYKCIKRCAETESTEYTDSYPQAVYTTELLDDIARNKSELGLSEQDGIDIRLWPRNYTQADTEMFVPGTKTLLPVFELLRDADGQTDVGFNAVIRTATEAVTRENFTGYAETIARIRDHYQQYGIGTKFTFTIHTSQETEDSTSDQRRYYAYVYRTEAAETRETQDVAVMASQFERQVLSEPPRAEL